MIKEKILKINNWLEIPSFYTGIVEHSNGTKAWYLKGLYHRMDGPAYISLDGSKYWYFEGRIHRMDGPAIEFPNGSNSYWYHGKSTTEEAIELLKKMMILKGLKNEKIYSFTD
jgi:hypothetical protein